MGHWHWQSPERRLFWGKDPVENPCASSILFAAFLSERLQWKTQKRCSLAAVWPSSAAFVVALSTKDPQLVETD